MNRTIPFFDYERCFAHYTERIMNIRQAKIRGERIVAKPVLLLTLIDGVEEGVFNDNHFIIDDWLEGRYLMLMGMYARSSQFDSPTGIEKPFWHLESDGFWHLRLKDAGMQRGKNHTPTKAWLKENVDYARLDEELWILLQNRAWRLRLRDYIVEHQLTRDGAKGRFVAEGLGILVALVLTA